MLIMFIFVSCGSPEQSPAVDPTPQPAPAPQPVVKPVKDPVPDVPYISDLDVNSLLSLSQPFVEQNFYWGTPERDLDPDFSITDSNYASPSRKYHSIAEFKAHMKSDYCLSEGFTNRLLDRMAGVITEHDGNLYVVSAGRGGRIDIGNEISRTFIREGDKKIILRVTYELLDDPDDYYEQKVIGSFDVDNILIYEDGRWVWDDIPEFR